MKLFSINNLANYLGIKESTVYAWVHTRQIPYYKVGRLVKFRVDEIEDWLRERKVEPSNDNFVT